MALKIRNDVQAHCTLMRQFTYELEWLPEKHYIAGTQIELRGGCYRSFSDWRYVRMEMEKADISFRWRIDPGMYEINLMARGRRLIFRAKLPYGVRKGEPCKIHLTAIPTVFAGINERLSLWTIGVAYHPSGQPIEEQDLVANKEEGSECELTVVAGPVERFSVYSRPMPDTSGRVRTCLIPEDRFGNPAAFEHPIEVLLEWEGATWTQEVQAATILTLDGPRDTGRLKVAIPMSALAATENIANGIRQGQDLVVIGNPVWPSPINGLRAAFGEFHWHTDVSSDGQRSLDEALRCARDYLNMDFAAPGDHNPQGEKWEQSVEALERFDEPDDFATFYGWEGGSSVGHENYYFTDPEHPLACGGKAGFTGGRPDEIADQLKQYHDFIAIPHHTNTVCENRREQDDTPYWHPYPWGEPAEYLRLIEIMQGRGNQERNVYTDVWRGWEQNNQASAQDALALGHKLGFTGGTDNHWGWPGRGYFPTRVGGVGDIHSPKSVILTGVWTPSVERQNIYDALWERHTWAVWDTRALVWFTVNDTLMGGELEVQKGAPLTAHIRLSAEDALQSVEIVSDGASVWISLFSELDIDVDVPLGRAEHSTYFYLRALQRDGGIIYASPIFVSVRGERC